MILRILFVASFPFPGPHGGPVYAAGLARSLARRGHEVVFVTGPQGTGPAPEGVDLVRVPHLPGGSHAPGSGPHWSRLWTDAGLLTAVRRLVARRNIQIVHAHHAEATLVARAAIGRGFPLVQSVHAALGDELPQWYPGLRGAGRLGRTLDRLAARAADVNVAISPAGQRHLTAIGAKDVALIPPGVDLMDVAGGDPTRAKKRWDLRGNVLVYTGNLDPYQDVERLVRAAVGLDATLLVVTVDDIAPLERLADAVGLDAAHRRFVRSGDFQDAKDAIAAADLFVVPRATCAGFPMKLLNALGAGVPAIVASTAGLDAPGSIEFDPADETSLPTVLRGLLADPGRRRSLGDKAMWAIMDTGTWEARAEALEAVYARLLGR